jgi:hypothetical protein
MAGSGAVLVFASPVAEPRRLVSDRIGLVICRVHKSGDLVAGQRDQPGRGGLTGAGGGCDHGEQGVGEHGDQGAASPGGPAADLVGVEPGRVLVAWKDSSMRQRVPATRTSSVSATGRGGVAYRQSSESAPALALIGRSSYVTDIGLASVA